MPEPIPHSILCPILIGRDTQVAALSRLLDQAAGGQGQIALISGEAGIGKSRLVAEVKTRAGQQGFYVMQGRCFETERLYPYAPLVDLLGAHMRSRPTHILAADFAGPAQALASLLPEFAPHIAPTGSTPPQDAEQQKRHLFEGFLHFLIQQARPLVVIVEDLHWCDDASLECLLFLGRRLTAYPILLILTYRPDEVNPSLGRLLSALDRERGGVEISLSRLTMTQTDSMLRAIFNLARPPQTDFLTALYELTEGNPFFTEEVLKSCVAAGDIFQIGGQWGRKQLSQVRIPRTVQMAVDQRIEPLSPNGRRLLSVAAVAGHRCDFALLQEATGQDETSLIEGMKELLAAQLIVEEATDVFVFRHALTQQAVSAGLLSRERRILHRTLGEALERLHSSTSETTDPMPAVSASLAYHFYAAQAWEKTFFYAQRAGEQAQALYAPQAVVDQFTRALEAERHLGRPPSMALLRTRGQAYEMRGDFDASRADLEQVLALTQATQDHRAEWQALLDLGFLWTSRDFGRAGGYFQAALAVSRTLNDPAAVAHTLNRVGNWYVNTERPHTGRIYHEEALGIFTSLHDTPGLAATLDLLAGALYFGSHVSQSMIHYAQAAERFRALGDLRGLASSLTWLAYQGPTAINPLVATAPLATCLSLAEEALQITRDIGWRPGEGFALFVLAFCLGAQGEYGRALALAHAGMDIILELGHAWTPIGHNLLGSLYADLLNFPLAQDHLTQSQLISHQNGSVLSRSVSGALLAGVYVAQHKLDQADSLLTALAALATDSIPPSLASDTEPLPTLALRMAELVRARLALQTNRPSAALQIVENVMAAAQSQATGNAQLVPALSLLHGEALAALGRMNEAEIALWHAHQAASNLGSRPQLWRIRLALGALYKALGRRDEAEAHVSAAYTLIQSLAATVTDVSLRDNFLRQVLGLAPAPPILTPRRVTKQEFDGLTEREREVAALIAQGKSDREIAEQLVLSKRTVSAHVGNILNKLGFSSRSQIAAWSVAKGL